MPVMCSLLLFMLPRQISAPALHLDWGFGTHQFITDRSMCCAAQPGSPPSTVWVGCLPTPTSRCLYLYLYRQVYLYFQLYCAVPACQVFCLGVGRQRGDKGACRSASFERTAFPNATHWNCALTKKRCVLQAVWHVCMRARVSNCVCNCLINVQLM